MKKRKLPFLFQNLNDSEFDDNDEMFCLRLLLDERIFWKLDCLSVLPTLDVELYFSSSKYVGRFLENQAPDFFKNLIFFK